MKKILMMLVAFIATTGAWAQTTTYDFDDSSMQGWTTIDADGDGHTWVLGSEVGGEYLKAGSSLEGSGHNSSADLVTSGSYSNVYGALTPDNYLVSPKVALGGQIKFYACGQDASYVAEHFGVAVSTTGNTDAADFTMLQEWTMTAAPSLAPAFNAPENAFRSPRRAQGNWYEYTVDLSAYAGQEGYVAIRHFGCTDQFLLNVDDIELSSSNATGTGFPLEGISEHGKLTFTVDGKEVKTAQGGQTVTATVTPNNGCFVTEVVAHAFAEWDNAQAPRRIAIEKDIELVAAGENTWTFTMPTASVEFIVAYKKDVTLTLASGDITAALEEASEGLPIRNLTLTLKNADYTISNSIEAGGNIVINGGGANIDASALSNPFVLLSKEPAVEANEAGGFVIDNITFQNVKISGLKSQLLYANKVKYLINKVLVDNSIIGIAGASKKTIFDFNSGGNTSQLLVVNSTIWADDATEWQNGGYYSSQSGQDVVSLGGESQLTSITNSTLYNIAKGKTTSTRRKNGQKWMTYEVKNSIIVNSGKSGQFVAGLNAGNYNANCTWIVDNNTFMFDGADVSAAENEKCKDVFTNIVEGDPGFADATIGDFTLYESSQPCKFRIGDPRWLTLYKPLSVTPAIDVTVPATLGELDPNVPDDEPTDLYYFLKSYIDDSENPAYIRMTLAPGANYVISKPLTVMTAIEIIGDAEKPATIDASQLGANPFVQINNQWIPVEAPNENGFYTNVYNVAFKNLNVTGLKGQFFYANKQKYLLPYLTVDNCQIRMEGASNKTFFDFNGGGFVELLTINNSTLSADDATKWSNGGFFSTQSGTKLSDCGAVQQKFVLTNNTFYNVSKGKTASTLRQNSQKFMEYEVINNVIVNSGKKGEFVKGLNAGQNNKTPSWLVNYNAFQWSEDNITFEDISEKELSGAGNCGISGSIEGEIAFKYVDATEEEPVAAILLGNYTLADCAQKTAKTGDPRWLKDNPTGIQTLNVEKQSEGAWYTLQGVRMAQPTKGVFIHNGKKVVVK